MNRLLQRFPSHNTVRFPIDYQKSHGNWMIDHNGQTYLDMFGSISSLPLGYNHPKLTKLTQDVHPSLLTHKPASGIFPSVDYLNDLNNILELNDSGLNKAQLDYDSFYTFSTGSEANENAIKLCFLRGKMLYPAIKPEKMKMISLSHGFHGRTVGALSLTHSQSGYKEGFPNIEWIKYDIDNDQDDLVNFIDIINEHHCIGMIVEPIRAEGGDKYYSIDKIRQIRNLLYYRNIPFIVDEVQTGLGATGKMWGFQHWDLEHKPDFVVVSKKCQTAGIFLDKIDIPDEPYKIFNTWFSNPWDLKKFNCILDVVNSERLLERVVNVGDFMKGALHRKSFMMNNKWNIRNVRGMGTFIAFDVDSNTEYLSYLQNEKNIIVGKCSNNTIRLRPSLTLDINDAEQFLKGVL